MKKIILSLARLFVFLSALVTVHSNGFASEKALESSTPLFVLHGGPGLDHKYLLPGLKYIERHRKIIFYDQKGCSQYDCAKDRPSLADLVHELEVKTAQYKTYGLLAHSWGGFLAMEFLRKTKNPPSEVIFVTPMPLTKSRLDRDWSKFAKTIPESEMKYFGPAPNQETCASNWKRAFRYYYFDKKEHAFPNSRCNTNLELSLMTEAGNFNSLAILNKLPKRTLWIAGAQDFLTPDPEVSWQTISESGHFPFDENPTLFQKVVREFFDSK